jgi:imidazolonepropionase-like amidohydrolase
MKTVRRSDGRTVGWVVVLGLLGTGVGSSLAAQTVAITGGTVFPVSGPKIERGTVLITDGKITAVGANVAVPAGAQRVDASGKWVTPGLVFLGSDAGTGVGSLGGFGESRVSGDVNPSFSPAEGIDPLALTIAQTRTGGVTTSVILPGGSFLPGRAIAIDLAGDNLETMLVSRASALVINLAGSRSAGGGSRAGGMDRLRRLFDDALTYQRRKLEYERGATQELAAPAQELAALLPALTGTTRMPVIVLADRALDIQNALRLAKEYRLRMVIGGAAEGWVMAKEIAAAGTPVAVRPLQNIPTFDALQARLDIATLMKEAGAEVIIAQADAGGDRNLRWVAGNAVRNGLSWDDALKAVTLAPARAVGLTDRGSLEVGKVANVVVWSGDPLDFASTPEKVYIRGQETSLRTRETELLEKYRTLPPK